VARNFVFIRNRVIVTDGYFGLDIYQPSALRAAHVSMFFGISVETGLPASAGEFYDFALFSKQIEVAVYRSQANARQPLAHHSVQRVGCWVRANLA